MKIQAFIEQQPEVAQQVFATFHDRICKYDTLVEASIGPVMGGEDALVYHQEGVFKYGLTMKKDHFSFHSMVMYTYPDLREELKAKTKGIKFQKGCLHFKTLAQINSADFQEFIQASAQQDFSPVIAHYQNKKK